MLCKWHVLIVGDDDETIRPILGHLMDAFGERVHLECASTLSIACESLADADFDVILFDLSLTDQHQSAALTTLQGHAPTTPVFLLTDTDPTISEAGPAAWGAGGCLLKRELKQGEWLKRLDAALVNRRSPERVEKVKSRHAAAPKS